MIFQDSTPAKFEDRLLPNLPKEILEDEYFKQNLPASYGTVSVSPPETLDADHEDGVFGTKLQMCSRGYQELSQNLSAFGQSSASWTASHEKSETNHSNANDCSAALGDGGRGLLNTPEYGKLNDNLSSIFREKGEELEGLNGDLYAPSNNFGKMNSTNCILNLTDTRQNGDNDKSVHKSTSIHTHSNNINNGAEEFANKMESSLGSKYRGGSDMPGLFDTLRYQNVTYDNLGSTHPLSVDVRPYGIAKYTFLAQFDNELSLNEGDMVYLRKYIDKEWMEGEVDGNRGLVPIGYVNVIVDCLEIVEKIPTSAQQPRNMQNNDCAMGMSELDPLTYTNSENVEAKIKPDTYHKVLFTFQAQMEEDLNVVEGEVIRVMEEGNENAHWVMVENSYGESGLCPSNHLDITNEFDGRALFDINRLLNYKSKKEQHEQDIIKQEISYHIADKHQPDPTTCRTDFKFFDPLCSPDDDMLLVEAELERKAKEANSLPIQEIVVRKKQEQLAKLSNSSVTDPESMRPAVSQGQKLSKHDAPKDIDTFISTNISKLVERSESNVSKHARNSSSSSSTFDCSSSLFQSSSNKTNPFTACSPLVPSYPSTSNSINKATKLRCQRSINESPSFKQQSHSAANLASNQLDFSKSILMELRGNKTGIQKSAPPRPSEPPKFLNSEKNTKEKFEENLNKAAVSIDNSSFTPTPPSRSFKKASCAPPPKPPPPAAKHYRRSQSVVEEPVYAKVNKSANNYEYAVTGSEINSKLSSESLLNKFRLPPPPRKKPPRPPMLHTSSNAETTTNSIATSQSISNTTITSINKSDTTATKSVATFSTSNAQLTKEIGDNYEANSDTRRYDDVYSTNGSEFADKISGTAGQEQFNQSSDNKTPTNEKCVDQFTTAKCQQHEEEQIGDKHFDNTYTKVEDAESLYGLLPQIPQRTSSYRSMSKVKEETIGIRPYINVKDLLPGTQDSSSCLVSSSGFTQASFPPDKDSLMSPPPTEHPPKIQTLPYRCISVASSSIKSRSMFYASV